MLTTLLALAGTASAAAIVPRQAASSKCCFGINVSGGVSNGGLGQYTDGQNRVGPGYGGSQFCYYGTQGSIVDAAGRGCVISPPTNQYQCDSGVTASTAADGITIAANGTISHGGSSTWYECYSTAAEGVYNIYATNPGSMALDCHPIMLTTVDSNCTNAASSSAVSSSSVKPSTSSVASSSVKASTSSAASSSIKASSSSASVKTSSGSASGSASTGSGSTRTTGSTLVVTSTVKVSSSSAPAVSSSKPATTSSVASPVVSSSKATTPATTPVTTPVAPTTTPVAPTTTPVAPTPGVSSCTPVTLPASTVTVTVTVTPACSSAPVGPVSPPASSKPATLPSAGTTTPVGPVSPPASSKPATSSGAGSSSAKPSTSTFVSTAVLSSTVTVPAGSSSTPAGTSAPAASSSKATSASASVSTAPAPSASSCPKGIAGQTYQYPHLIVPVNKNTPNTAYGTQYFAGVNSTFSTIFNFDIPASYAGKTCSLEMLLPLKKDLETSDYTLTGSGAIDFQQLAGVATQATTYANQPKVAKDLGVFDITPGTQTIVASGPCAAGTAVSYELVAQGDTQLYEFVDYNPSALGLFIVAC